MTEKFTRWDAVDHLKTEEDMALYLDACLDEDPGDGTLVRAALNDVAGLSAVRPSAAPISGRVNRWWTAMFSSQ